MNLSSIQLSEDAKIWLREVWNFFRENGRAPDYQVIRFRTKDIISNTFRPLDLPKELIDNNATEITLIGVLCCDPNTDILEVADRIFEYVKIKINSSPDQTDFETRVIADDLTMSATDVEIVLTLISRYGSFWGGASKASGSAFYTTFRIDSPHVFETYATHDTATSVIEDFIARYKIVESVNERLAERGQRRTEKALLYALSTDVNDSALVGMGMLNRGVIGYVLTDYVEGTLPLTAVKLQFRGDDFLYTTNIESERLERRNPRNLGVLGYVYKESRINATQLFRYFDPTNLVHLFVTRPINIPKNFRNESKDNPIHIYDVETERTTPLYFFSNQSTVFSESISRTSNQSENISIGEQVNAEIVRQVYSRADIKILESNEIEPALGVEQLAAEVAGVITHLKVEPGNMTGIFGPWGRGKSYLMNFIWRSLQIQAANFRYYKVTYQAWRYQDTPAAWAYLYETFSKCYLGNPKAGIRDFFVYHSRLWKLNVRREGYFTALSIAFLLFAGTVGYSIIAFDWENIALDVLKILGVPAAGFLIYFLTKNLNLSYFSKAFNIIKKYGVRATFKDNLGIQAEIQKEIIHLVSVWTDSNKENRKIVLFVDDLDRCKEERTIEIIDSLRIILDDEEVKEKLIVICAIDDRILKRAIHKKYSDVGEVHAGMLVKEYIDKLFIFTLKLASLNNTEAREFFGNLTKKDIRQPSKKAMNQGRRDAPTISTRQQTTLETERLPSSLEVASVDQDRTPRITLQTLKEISEHELKRLMESLTFMVSPTPRRIKIVYYRYLFAKNILIAKHPTPNDNSFWLRQQNQGTLMKLLILLSDKDSAEIGSLRKTALIDNGPELKVPILDSESVDRVEFLKLLDVLETVIAY